MSVTAVDHRREASLHLANAIRLERHQLWLDLRTGEITAAEVLSDPPECVRAMSIADFLERCPRIGTTKVRRLNLAAAREHVNLLRPVGEITPRQRDWLLEQLPRLQAAKHTLPGRSAAAA